MNAVELRIWRTSLREVMKVARRVAHTTVNPIFESPVFGSRGAVVFHPRARLLVPGTGLALGKRGRRTRASYYSSLPSAAPLKPPAYASGNV